MYLCIWAGGQDTELKHCIVLYTNSIEIAPAAKMFYIDMQSFIRKVKGGPSDLGTKILQKY